MAQRPYREIKVILDDLGVDKELGYRLKEEARRFLRENHENIPKEGGARGPKHPLFSLATDFLTSFGDEYFATVGPGRAVLPRDRDKILTCMAEMLHRQNLYRMEGIRKQESSKKRARSDSQDSTVLGSDARKQLKNGSGLSGPGHSTFVAHSSPLSNTKMILAKDPILSKHHGSSQTGSEYVDSHDGARSSSPEIPLAQIFRATQASRGGKSIFSLTSSDSSRLPKAIRHETEDTREPAIPDDTIVVGTPQAEQPLHNSPSHKGPPQTSVNESPLAIYLNSTQVKDKVVPSAENIDRDSAISEGTEQTDEAVDTIELVETAVQKDAIHNTHRSFVHISSHINQLSGTRCAQVLNMTIARLQHLRNGLLLAEEDGEEIDCLTKISSLLELIEGKIVQR